MSNLRSDHMLNLFLEAYPGVVAYVDFNYCYQFTNMRHIEWFQLDSKVSPGSKVIESIGKENFEIHKPFMDRALNGEKVQFRAVLGSREVEQIYEPDVDENGFVRGFIALAIDITDQKNAEKEAKENEARFRSLTEVMPQLVWVADGKGDIIWFNENWPRVTGSMMGDNLGRGWLDTVHEEDRGTAITNWTGMVQSGIGGESEFRLKMVNGTYRWHMSRAIPIKDELGQTARWVGTTTDIEEQKKAKQLADKEKERIYSIFLQAPVVMLMFTGPEHVIEMMNSAAEEYFFKKETIGVRARESILQYQDQGFLQILDDIYSSGLGRVQQSMLLLVYQENGQKREKFFDLFFEPIKDENGITTGIFNMAVDVTDQIDALMKAEEKEKKLEEALFARDQFLSIASHELKTPLSSLKLQAQLTLRALERKTEISTERHTALANQNNNLASRITRLIDDMLDVSRINTGKLELYKTQEHFDEIVNEVVSQMSVLFEAAGLDTPKVNINQKIVGEWDRFRLEQVCGNLLTNAIRYGRGLPIEIEIKKKENMAILSVKDFGYGIAQTDLTRIFERFERAISSSEVSGLGLGLFISKEIVKSHQGKIWGESRLGEGSTFYVEIPCNE